MKHLTELQLSSMSASDSQALLADIASKEIKSKQKGKRLMTFLLGLITSPKMRYVWIIAAIALAVLSSIGYVKGKWQDLIAEKVKEKDAIISTVLDITKQNDKEIVKQHRASEINEDITQALIDEKENHRQQIKELTDTAKEQLKEIESRHTNEIAALKRELKKALAQARQNNNKEAMAIAQAQEALAASEQQESEAISQRQIDYLWGVFCQSNPTQCTNTKDQSK